MLYFSEAKTALDAAKSMSLTPVLVLMTDGACWDTDEAVSVLTRIDQKFNVDGLQVHLVAFGSGADISILERLKQVVTEGHVHKAEMGQLMTAFRGIEQTLNNTGVVMEAF